MKNEKREIQGVIFYVYKTVDCTISIPRVSMYALPKLIRLELCTPSSQASLGPIRWELARSVLFLMELSSVVPRTFCC